ncbi:hypothetical protein E4T56_gene4651 [Termitomyces sp. T112]|nr:hypothetical protein C0989_001016 [Termitomyces sp. Mn162]KAG5726586.1 hypothetical protein E4T56_gene4651 [Termitomyces sp. T112]KNZ80383.1 hypothetical protein J132_06120 [Termitomyces sp. J132]
MTAFSSPSLRTVGIILTEIYGQNVANEEFRFYEVYNIVFTQVLQALEGKGDKAADIRDEVAIAPQYVLKREALTHPIDPYVYQQDLGDIGIARSDVDELEEAENYLAEASMEVHHSDEELHNENDSGSEVGISTEYRIPDLLASHITSLHGRRTLLFVEIKPDVLLTEDYAKELHDQAQLQAAFAFEVFPAERSIFSLMIVGRKFFLKIFDKELCKLRHHLLTKSDEESYTPSNKKRGKNRKMKVVQRMWRNIFRETVTKSGDQTTNVEIHGFTKGFKKAMDLVMKSTGVGRIQWGDC